MQSPALCDGSQVISSASKIQLRPMSSARQGRLRGNALNPFAEMLQVELVADGLLSFLCLDDMKTLSQVSWGMMKVVRKSSKFHDLVRLHLCRQVLKNGLFKFEGDKNPYWKNISMDLFPSLFINDNGQRDSLGDVMEAAHSLTLYLGKSPEVDDVAHRIGEVLQRATSLKGLGIDIATLGDVVFTNVKFQWGVKNLLALDIHGPRSSANKFDDWAIFLGSKWRRMCFCQNIIHLSKIVHSLERFSFLQIFPMQFDKVPELSKCIPVLLNANRRSLEAIALRFDSWEAMVDLQFPRLHRLKIHSSDGLRAAKWIESFLLLQPALEELDIFFSKNCDFRIVEGLQRDGKLSKLKRLSLGTPFRSEDFGVKCHPMDWRILQGMIALKDFSLSAPFTVDKEWFGIGDEILTFLPPATEKISIQSRPRFWNWKWNSDSPLCRFRNLQELDLLHSHGALNDFKLQGLIVHCPKLRRLAFAHCYNLSDHGLAERGNTEGRTGGWIGVSLDQLKGLTHLTIRTCPGITREGLLGVMNFQHLRSFDYEEFEMRDTRVSRRLLRWLICRRSEHPRAIKDKNLPPGSLPRIRV